MAVFVVVFLIVNAIATWLMAETIPERVRGDATPWMQEEPFHGEDYGPICEELAWGAKVYYVWDDEPLVFGETLEPEDRAEYEYDYNLMIAEIEELWTMFFDDDNAKDRDKRRDRFNDHATDLADAVVMYQDAPTDIGGQLPMHENVHLLMAWMVAKESSITYDAVGDKGEVGLMQIMPNNRKALAGYSPDQVQHNPKLGLLLGVRWMAAMIEECPDTDVFDVGWSDHSWLGPLSVYAGGPNAIRKNGTCKVFKTARERIARVLMYRSRIEQEKSRGNFPFQD